MTNKYLIALLIICFSITIVCLIVMIALMIVNNKYSFVPLIIALMAWGFWNMNYGLWRITKDDNGK